MAGRFQDTVRIKVRGIPQTVKNIRGLRKVLLKVAADHAARESELLYDHTGRVVPYLSGQLLGARFRRQAEGRGATRPTWLVGYNQNQAPYAWAVHQIPNRFHPVRGPYNDPKMDHFLSVPRDMLAQTYAARAQVKFNQAIRHYPVSRVR